MTTYATPELVRELEAAVGDVVTDGLDDYAADTYWKALAMHADGSPSSSICSPSPERT